MKIDNYWIQAKLDYPPEQLTRTLAYKMPTSEITCADGSTLSVQATAGHYCTPRNDVGPYTHVEVGYPTGKIPDWWDDSDNVMGYVDVELVIDHINSCGGVV